MKKIATLMLGCLFAVNVFYAQTFSDTFESYNTGVALGPQSPDWRTWAGAGGGADDANVITTDNHTTGGTKSVYFSSNAATGGPQDVVLPFTAGAPLTTGQFTFTSWFKVPTNKTAYFNFQGNATMGNLYTLDCWMTAAGVINIENTGTVVATGTYPPGAWFELKINANFNNNSWELFINNVSQGTWSNATNQIWGIDYFPADAAASFWIDDVSYNVVPYTLPAINAAGNQVNVANGLIGQARNIAITVKNLGTSAITSFDLSIVHNAGTPFTQSVSGLNLASLATTTVAITTPFVLVSGANTFTATVSNVNGAGADNDPADDVVAKTINATVTPAQGKMVVTEEATGTWCQWCPRGAVFMDLMDSLYSGYIAPIAVHNLDPMTNTTYDLGMGPLIGGYPSSITDRLPFKDPSLIEPDFLTRVVIAPKALLVNGATYNTGTRELKVSITATILAAISGNYKVACVITEDEVTGTTGYAQSNAYAGGNSGVMGGFELLPNPVPASLMVYDHVARFISPSFAGFPNAIGASAAIGAVFTYNFTYILPASFDDTQIHIIGMFIEPSGKVDNASSTRIAQAVTNGFISGIGVGVNEIASAPDASINLYPNPSSNQSTISLNLLKASNVQVAIYAVDGSLIGNKNYGELNGAMLLPVDMTNYASGMYFVNVIIDGNTSVLKLIKE